MDRGTFIGSCLLGFVAALAVFFPLGAKRRANIPALAWMVCLVLGAGACFYGLSHSSAPSLAPRVTVTGIASEFVEKRAGRDSKFLFRRMVKSFPEAGRSIVRRTRYLGLLLLLGMAPALSADIPGVIRVDVSGHWIVVISMPGRRLHGEAEFLQTGYQISGWLDLGDGDHIPISAVVYEGKFVVTTHPEPRQRVAFDRMEAPADGSHMKGTVFPGGGKIELKRYRPPRPFREPQNLHSPAHK